MLIDTDVLVWYMRGNEKARQIIENLESIAVSVITYMELVQGMRNKKELNQLRKFLRTWDAGLLYLNEEISVKAMFYVERHYLSHSLQIADALIAATAITIGLPLLTANSKHYQIIKELELVTFHS
jgi:predicted nucleic acid-binding protein